MRRASRRRFIALGAAAAGALLAVTRARRIRAAQHGHAAPATRSAPATRDAEDARVLDASQWALLEAMTARIIPSEDGLGAREAGVVRFIDRSLAGPERASIVDYVVGLAGLEAAATALLGEGFLQLDAEGQDRVLETIESGTAPAWPSAMVRPAAFFAMVRLHTLQGFLADPVHGGNQGYVGWRLTGYPGPRHRSGGVSERQLMGIERLT